MGKVARAAKRRWEESKHPRDSRGRFTDGEPSAAWVSKVDAQLQSRGLPSLSEQRVKENRLRIAELHTRRASEMHTQRPAGGGQPQWHRLISDQIGQRVTPKPAETTTPLTRGVSERRMGGMAESTTQGPPVKRSDPLFGPKIAGGFTPPETRPSDHPRPRSSANLVTNSAGPTSEAHRPGDAVLLMPKSTDSISKPEPMTVRAAQEPSRPGDRRTYTLSDGRTYSEARVKPDPDRPNTRPAGPDLSRFEAKESDLPEIKPRPRGVSAQTSRAMGRGLAGAQARRDRLAREAASPSGSSVRARNSNGELVDAALPTPGDKVKVKGTAGLVTVRSVAMDGEMVNIRGIRADGSPFEDKYSGPNRGKSLLADEFTIRKSGAGSGGAIEGGSSGVGSGGAVKTDPFGGALPHVAAGYGPKPSTAPRPGKKVTAKGLPDGYEIRNNGATDYASRPEYDVYGPDGTIVGKLTKIDEVGQNPTAGTGSRISSGYHKVKGFRFAPTGTSGNTYTHRTAADAVGGYHRDTAPAVDRMRRATDAELVQDSSNAFSKMIRQLALAEQRRRSQGKA